MRNWSRTQMERCLWLGQPCVWRHLQVGLGYSSGLDSRRETSSAPCPVRAPLGTAYCHHRGNGVGREQATSAVDLMSNFVDQSREFATWLTKSLLGFSLWSGGFCKEP